MIGGKSCIQDIKFKIYSVSKSILAARAQNFVSISGAQKPAWAKFLEFEFFLSGNTRLSLPEQKSTWGYIIFIYKSYIQ